MHIVLTSDQPTGPTDPVEQHYFRVEAYSFRTLRGSSKVDDDELLQTVMAGTTPVLIAIKVSVTPYNP